MRFEEQNIFQKITFLRKYIRYFTVKSIKKVLFYLCKNDIYI